MPESMEYILYGDIEAAVVDLLSNDSRVSSFRDTDNNPPHITTDLIGYQRGMCWVEVYQAGGSLKFLRTKRARIDIVCHAKHRKDANRLARTIQAVMFARQASYTGFGINYQSCQIETDIFRSNEKLEDDPEYIQSLRLLVKPHSP